jgi:hypothetical protein
LRSGVSVSARIKPQHIDIQKVTSAIFMIIKSKGESSAPNIQRLRLIWRLKEHRTGHYRVRRQHKALSPKVPLCPSSSSTVIWAMKLPFRSTGLELGACDGPRPWCICSGMSLTLRQHCFGLQSASYGNSVSTLSQV